MPQKHLHIPHRDVGSAELDGERVPEHVRVNPALDSSLHSEQRKQAANIRLPDRVTAARADDRGVPVDVP
jgi:hypothetical protein